MPRLPFPIRALNQAGATLNALGLELPRIREAALLQAASRKTGLSDFGDDLFRVYPNAEVIFMHRAPTAVMPSMSSLIYQMRFLTQRSSNPARVGREQLDRWGWALDRCLAARDEMPDKARQIVDLRFNDFMQDPLAAVEGIYERFGWPIDDDVRGRMKTFLETNPRDKHGTHRYTLDMFDLSLHDVNERMASYAERFDLGS
jgi:hypothetical protein